MTESRSREKLVEVIDRNVFRPILETSAERYSGRDRETFEEVQEKTRRTRDKYRKEYGSADKVYEMYRSDLSSDPAQEVSRVSRRLGLPTLEDVEDEVTQVAREVGVRDSERKP